MKILLEKPYLLALFISAALIIWLLSGLTEVTPSQEESRIEPLSTSPPLKVQVREQRAEFLTQEIVLTGRTAPLRTVTLRAEIGARIEKIVAKKGARLHQNDLIVRLATDDRDLQLQQAQALVKQRQFEYQAKQNLSKKGYQSEIQIAEALTLLEQAKTQVKQAKIALENTKIYAPFAGILVQRFVEEGDYVSVGDNIAEIMDEDPFLIIGEVTELQRHHLKLGDIATAQLVTGATIKGKIRRIAAQADQATRTFQIEIEVPNPDGKLVAGVTSEIHIPIAKILAHKISAALLSLNDAGVLGIKAVNTKNQVEFYPAQFARAATDGIWLTGLPRKLRFITVGQGFVRSGDEVQPIPES